VPCDECGESAMKKHGGVVGGNLRYDDSGEAHYVCLDCTIGLLKESNEN